MISVIMNHNSIYVLTMASFWPYLDHFIILVFDISLCVETWIPTLNMIGELNVFSGTALI